MIARPFLLFGFLILAAISSASESSSLLSHARKVGLGQNPEWLRLGHWKRGRFSRHWVSDAGDTFFLSPQGRENPQLELEALLLALSRDPEPDHDRDVRCRFPLRSEWLVKTLGQSVSSVNHFSCPQYDHWRELLEAKSLSLIFASSYFANPSSMFGHTFLRIGRKSTQGDLLRDNTLNFSATTGQDNGLLFAVKGVLGLYPGTYSMMPYYMKVVEYNGIENRDLWEYELNVSSTDVERLAAHAWEIGQITMPYYFFSKNCSYQLLPLLEAVAPRLSLPLTSSAIVAPVDTLLTIQSVPGLVRNVRYRPSHATIMKQRRQLLSRFERHAAELYMTGRAEQGDNITQSLDPTRKALILDSALDHVLYKKGFSPDVPTAVRELERNILVRRAKIDELPVELSAPSWAIAPERGHLRHRFQTGFGARNGDVFSELAWRPGHHDLMDHPRGYLPGAAIEGFSWRVRYDFKRRQAYVRKAQLVDIVSVNPWDSWTRMPAWSAGTGLDTAFEKGQVPNRSLVYAGHMGSGISLAWGERALTYGLMEAHGSVGPVLRYGWRINGALRGGINILLARDVSMLMEGVLTATAWGDQAPNHHLRLGMNWALARDLALRGEGLLRGPHREAGLYAVLYH